MSNIRQIILNEIFKALREVDEDYRIEHSAPGKGSGSPLHDLSETYPEDFYSNNGPRYYGDAGGDNMDFESWAIISRCRNRPNRTVRIYRAVPSVPTVAKRISILEKHQAYILQYGKLPRNVGTFLGKSKYYGWATDEIEKLSVMQNVKQVAIKINSGDWVTVNRRYALDHGRSALDGNYRIISKAVPASQVYTNGDSIHEQGWDPS